MPLSVGTPKQYSGGASSTTLAVAITAVSTEITVVDGSGLPDPTGTIPSDPNDPVPSGALPFVITVDRGTPSEEKILISGRTVNNLTVQDRGFDGTVATSHGEQAMVEHTIDAESFSRFEAHVGNPGETDVHNIDQIEGLQTKVDALDAHVDGASTDAHTISNIDGLQNEVDASAKKNENLADLTSPATARTNLGLGTMATQAEGTAGSSFRDNTANDTRFAQQSLNLSDLANAATARTNLGLGSMATRAVGTADASHRTNLDNEQLFVQQSLNLSDLADAATARTNLGLGTMALEARGTSSASFRDNDQQDARFLQLTGGTVSGLVTLSGERLDMADAADLPQTSGAIRARAKSSDPAISIHAATGSTARTMQTFLNVNGTVGSIKVQNSATTYNTTSDYRIKDNFEAMSGALERVGMLRPGTWDWKGGGQGEGLIAHEAAEVVPLAVSGVKDGDELQAIDYSKLVPVLIGAVQELAAKVATLEGDV